MALRRKLDPALLAGGMVLLSATGAAEEVCDKVREGWKPTDGPFDQFDELLWWLSSPLGIAIVLCLAAMVLVPRRWLGFLGLAGVAAMVALVALSWRDIGDLDGAPLREGCVAEPYLALGFYMVLAAVLVMRLRTIPRADRLEG